MLSYKDSGVDINEGYNAVAKYKEYAARTKISGLLSGLGSFSGAFAIPAGLHDPVMISGTDGVGTKLDIAFKLKKYDTVGIDCVAMSVNDILCSGVASLFFLDYIACGKLDANIAAALVKGVSDGCIESGCALLGGETAEMPGFYDEGKYDLAGFAVGVAEKSSLLTGRLVQPGDALVGLSSTGVHSNGFSLVRKLVTDLNAPYSDDFGTYKTIGEALLSPTRIYVKPVTRAISAFPGAIHAMSHITGGGFIENVPRMFGEADNLTAVIHKGTWQVLPIFDELVKKGADTASIFNTFNMGLGIILAVENSKAGEIVDFFNNNRSPDIYSNMGLAPLVAYKIGEVEQGSPSIKIV